MACLTFDAYGTPAPKGSYNAVTNRRTGRTLFVPASRGEHAWRRSVEEAAYGAWTNRTGLPMPRLEGPLSASVRFLLPRPKSVRRDFPTVKPDLDKLVRSTWDGLTSSGLIRDDARITDLRAEKRYADWWMPGALISIEWEDAMENLQTMCRSCNSRKGNRVDVVQGG